MEEVQFKFESLIPNISLVHSMCVHAKLLQSRPTLCDPMDCSSPGSSVRGDSPGKNTGVGCHALLQGDLLDPGIKLTSLSLFFLGKFYLF